MKHGYPSKISTGLAIERLARELYKHSDAVKKFQAERIAHDRGMASADPMSSKIVRFAILHHGIVIPQVYFSRELVEKTEYLYELNDYVPDQFITQRIADFIAQSVAWHVKHGGSGKYDDTTTQIYKAKLDSGAKDFYQIKVMKAEARVVSYDIPVGSILAGSW
jgi:hypothetical protein